MTACKRCGGPVQHDFGFCEACWSIGPLKLMLEVLTDVEWQGEAS
jgi:hypothetical protein